MAKLVECSFCGKKIDRDDITKRKELVIVGKTDDILICSECVSQCDSILKEESKNTKKVETNNQVTKKPTQNSTQPKTETKATSPTALNLNSTSKAPSNLKNTNIAEPVENIKQTKKSYRKARK